MIRVLVCVFITLISITANSQETSAEKTAQLKTLNGHFPFQPPSSVEQWEQRRDELKRRVQVATGLWPLPERTPLQAKVYGKIIREGFTVEKVHFQSLPGHFVTGLLFRPSPENRYGIISGKRPAVLSPHGHGGRTMRLTDQVLSDQLEIGGEIHEQSGRYPKLARCAHLARMGCVTLIFDMLGYADSQQIPHSVAHRHADARPEESENDQPCFYSISADLHLQSIMGLQTWNAIRSLDFLAQLSEVDPERIGVTGGSGGGTQTILLGAIDDRVKASFPNGMVSTSMQGGCYCENCNYLRVGTGNVELAALYAPKPQGMTAADDWTRDMMSDGYPQLKQLYEMLGVPDNVMCRPLLHFKHNYNYVTRATMYPWMAKHLGLPTETPLVEEDFEPLTENEMAVWDKEHPAPAETGVAHERNVLHWWRSQSDQAIKSLIPNQPNSTNAPKSQSADKTERYAMVIGGAWKVIFDRRLPRPREVAHNTTETESDNNSRGDSWSISQVSHPEWNLKFPVTVQPPPGDNPAKRVVIVAESDGSPWNQSRASGLSLYSQATWGDFDTQFVIIQSSIPSDKQPLIDDSRSYSGFTFGYNRPHLVKQYEKILCVIAAFDPQDQSELHLVSSGDAMAMSVAAASALTGDAVDTLTIEFAGTSKVDSYQHSLFLPGSEKYLGIGGLLSLRAPMATTILSNQQDQFQTTRRVFAAAGAAKKLIIEHYDQSTTR